MNFLKEYWEYRKIDGGSLSIQMYAQRLRDMKKEKLSEVK